MLLSGARRLIEHIPSILGNSAVWLYSGVRYSAGYVWVTRYSVIRSFSPCSVPWCSWDMWRWRSRAALKDRITAAGMMSAGVWRHMLILVLFRGSYERTSELRPPVSVSWRRKKEVFFNFPSSAINRLANSMALWYEWLLNRYCHFSITHDCLVLILNFWVGDNYVVTQKSVIIE